MENPLMIAVCHGPVDTGLSCRTTFILTEADNILTGSESRQSKRIETFIVSSTHMIELFKHVKNF